MPTKLNSSGQQQNYDKSTGRYAKMSVDNVARVLNGDKPIYNENIRDEYRNYIDKSFAQLTKDDIEYLNDKAKSGSILFDRIKNGLGNSSDLTEDEIDYFRDKLKEYGINDEYPKDKILKDNEAFYNNYKRMFVNNKKAEQQLKELDKFYKIANEKGWKISESPYSTSAYALNPYDNITWGYKPEGSLRFSDHWNFISRGELHEETDDSFLSESIKTGVYENGRYVNTEGRTFFEKKEVDNDEIYNNSDLKKWFNSEYGGNIRDYDASKLVSEYINQRPKSRWSIETGAEYEKIIDIVMSFRMFRIKNQKFEEFIFFLQFL